MLNFCDEGEVAEAKCVIKLLAKNSPEFFKGKLCPR